MTNVYSPEYYFSKIALNDVKPESLRNAKWIYDTIKGQSFQQYIESKPIRPTTVKNVIYLLPIGKFTSWQSQLIDLTREYLEIFFQMKTIVLTNISNDMIPKTRVINDRTELVIASNTLEILSKELPTNGIALMAIANVALYRLDKGHYVYGTASYAQRSGISSIYRLNKGDFNQENYLFCLKRLILLTSHEIGHILSLAHCKHALCNMNGCNILVEMDGQPTRLCSQCQRKLHWNLQYDNVDRLHGLMHFFKTNGLENEYIYLEKDLELVENI